MATKLKVKKGDLVAVRIGKDRGKTGKVIRVYPEERKVLLENLNVFKRHTRPKSQGAKGEIVSIAKPLPIENVALYCGNCKRGVRVGMSSGDKKKSRVCVICNTSL